MKVIDVFDWDGELHQSLPPWNIGFGSYVDDELRIAVNLGTKSIEIGIPYPAHIWKKKK